MNKVKKNILNKSASWSIKKSADATDSELFRILFRNSNTIFLLLLLWNNIIDKHFFMTLQGDFMSYIIFFYQLSKVIKERVSPKNIEPSFSSRFLQLVMIAILRNNLHWTILVWNFLKINTCKFELFGQETLRLFSRNNLMMYLLHFWSNLHSFFYYALWLVALFKENCGKNDP